MRYLKSIILTLVFLFMFQIVNANNKDSIVINKVVDTITSEISYMTSDVLLCKKPNTDDYFYVDVYINAKYQFDLLFIKKNGIGSCNGDDILTFYFTDGTNMELKSYNAFRCDDMATFKLTNGEILKLSYKEIKGVRYTNGYSFDSYTHPIPTKNKRHFIQIIKALYGEGTK